MATKKYVSLSKLSTFLDNLSDKFAVVTHTHKLSDISDYKVDTALSPDSVNPVQNKVLDAEFDSIAVAMNSLESSIDDKSAEVDEKIDEVSGAVVDLSETVSTNYDESIIGLSIDGQVITYIKGDGSVHTMITQDTNTEYSLGTDETTGLTKLYATTGNAEDGTMTQKAIKTELDKKVGVNVDDSQDTLVFTI